MKKLTLKQVYGFSIMSWELFYNKFDNIVMERMCSFCRDSEQVCRDCRILPSICDLDRYDSENIYARVSEAEMELEDLVEDLIDALKKEYRKLEKDV